MKISARGAGLMTTLPLFAAAGVWTWQRQWMVAGVCAAGGVLLALLQWITVRAFSRPSDRLASGQRRPV